jgi:hypothetical protein
MTSEEFKTALREAEFGGAQGWIVDVSGKCPGFATLPSFNKGVLNRNATLSKVIWERDAELSGGLQSANGRPSCRRSPVVPHPRVCLPKNTKRPLKRPTASAA